MGLLSEWKGNLTGTYQSVKTTKGKQAQQQGQPQRPLPTQDPGFNKFSRWFSYPQYRGLFQWQIDCNDYLRDAKYEMIVVSRDHGKSIYLGNKCEHKLQFGNYDILYLGWTDRRKEVAQNICNFFEMYDQIDLKRSEYHFTIKNGGKFDCYLITSKDTLGMHSFGKQARFDNLSKDDVETYQSFFDGEQSFDKEQLEEFIKDRNKDRKLLIVIDDPIDDSFMKERHKEEDLERRFMSTIYNINPDQWIFTGTRKFEGDFFDFVRKTFHKRLVEFNRGPYLREGELHYNEDLSNNPKNLTCPERFTHPDCPSYSNDMKVGKRDLNEIYESLLLSGKLYWWFAEYWNDPHPIAGETWDAVEFETMLDTPVNRKYDICMIMVDRATTLKNTSDYTGCPIVLREMSTGNRIIIEDFTDHISFDDLLIILNDFIIEFTDKHETILVLLVVETQGGGDDFITLANNLYDFTRKGVDGKPLMGRDGKPVRVKNRIPELASIIPIHNTGEKVGRIRERINPGIKTGSLRALHSMRNSEIVMEILQFPHSAKLDAIDGLANGEFLFLETYPNSPEFGQNRLEHLKYLYDHMGRVERNEIENQPTQSNHILDILSKFERRGRAVFDEF